MRRLNVYPAGIVMGFRLNRTRAVPSPLVISVLTALFCSTLFSQAVSGDLVGSVYDASGGAVPKAVLTAANTATDVKSSATTNASGQYRFSNLPPGNYDVTVALAGFATATLKDVAVQLNRTAPANFTLRVGAVSASVDVTEAPAMLDTTTAQITTTYTARQAQDLPAASVWPLEALNLSLLQAGVTSSGGLGAGTGPSVGGQRPRNNNFTVDGVDDNNKSVTGPTVIIPNESVAEFTVLQNQFRAEFGHSSAGQFNTVVKSGSNAFHGTLYEYVENRHMDALGQAYRNENILTNPRFDRNQVGANYGGPILRDKLFFFASFEYDPLGEASTSPTPAYAPTLSGYQALASAPGISQTNLAVLKQYAVAPTVTAGAPNINVGGVPVGQSGAGITVGGVTVPTGIIPITAPSYTNGYFGVLSSDYVISSADQLRGRLVYNDVASINTGATLPAFFTMVASTAYLATLAEYHTFNPLLTSEFRLGYSRFNSNDPVGDQKFPGLDQFPNLEFINLHLQVGPNPNFPQAMIFNVYSGVENVTWALGNHTLKFGTEFRRYIAPERFTAGERGNYFYTAVTNYLLDLTPDYEAQRTLGNPVYYGDQIATYSYVQDTWRARRNLTVDLGLRYEYTTVPQGMRSQQLNALASVSGVLTFHAPTASTDGLAPRAGLAYSPGKNGSTVIRAGFGIAYDVIFDNIGQNTLPPEFSTTVNAAPGGTNFLANGGIAEIQNLASLTPARARALTSSYIPDQALPYSINWNFGVQHVLSRDYTLEVRYLGTRGVHELLQEQINIQSDVTPSQNIPTFESMPSVATLASLPLTLGQLRSVSPLIPQYANAGFLSPITAYMPEGWSRYNGLAVQLNRRLSRGLQYQAAYTWSHNIDNSTAEINTTALSPRRPQDFQHLRSEKAASALDRRQRLTLSLIYDAPWFKGNRNWFMRNVAGNWELAPIYTYESPEYYTVQSELDSNLNGDSAGDRTIVNLNGVAGAGSGVIGLDRSGNQISPTAAASQTNNIVAYVASNPNARYIEAGPGAYANAGRNTQPIRPIDNVDLALIKHFVLGESFRFDLAGQAFNLFNHPQFVAGSFDTAGLTMTTGASVVSYVGVSNPLFNNPTYAFGSNPRVLQVTAKFRW